MHSERLNLVFLPCSCSLFVCLSVFLFRMVVVLGSWFFLSTQLRSTLFVAVVMVSVSLYLYNVPAASSAASAAAGAPIAYTAVATSGMDAKYIEMDTMDDANDGIEKGDA